VWHQIENIEIVANVDDGYRIFWWHCLSKESIGMGTRLMMPWDIGPSILWH